MSLVTLIEYADASADVRAVYDDIMRTRGTDWINNFWKALANDPAQLKRIWESVQQVMAPGAITCFTFCQTRRSSAGSFASAFQKLLIQSTPRVFMMSS